MLAFLLYVIVLAVATWKHTFWRDETEAWLVARTSHGVLSLLHNIRYEGHPPLWYVLVFVITRFTSNPEWMKLPNFLSAIAVAAIVFSYRRIPLPVRFGFVFSYFLLFEYSVIDRNYMIGILLLVVSVWLIDFGNTELRVPILLSLAALTSLPALIVAVCLYPVHLVPLLRGPDKPTVRSVTGKFGLKRCVGLLLFCLCSLYALSVIKPPADSGLLLDRNHWHSVALDLTSAILRITGSYLPIPNKRVEFWNSALLAGGRSGLTLGIALACGLFLFFRKKPARYFLTVASLLLLCQMAVTTRTAMRHVGWLFVVFLLAFLIDQIPLFEDASPLALPMRSWRFFMLYGVLAAQVATGVFAIGVSLRYPFSSSRQVATFLQEQHLDHVPILFAPSYVSPSVMAYLKEPSTYFLERGGQANFIVWDKAEFVWRSHTLTSEDLAKASPSGERPVVITPTPLPPEQAAALKLSLLQSYPPVINSYDSYYIYH
jgi:hypothetical protein